jgi:ATP-dependent RNA helicase RhlE
MNERSPSKAPRRPYNAKGAQSNTTSGAKSSTQKSSSPKPRPKSKPQAKPQSRGKGQGAYIDPQRFVNKNVIQQEDVEFVATHAFVNFKFTPALQNNIAAHGYERPTPIQDKAIPVILEGNDFIGLANTGTGKTAAFILPIINFLQTQKTNGKALIVLPTRELAIQVDEEFKQFARGLKLYSTVCVGGANIRTQITALARNPHLIIGTPGRLKDLCNQNELALGNVDIFVLDEADRMLDMGFLPDIRHLISQLPKKRQTLCFSATITPDIEILLQKILVKPVTVSVRSKATSEHISQEVIQIASKEEKFEQLLEILEDGTLYKVIIFGQTKWGVQRLADNLNKLGYTAEAIHGNKSQPQRQRALNNFKDDKVRILVATDVAARGLDIPDVSAVINYDQPKVYDDYIHRIGRTGRAGKGGKAFTFVEK